MTGTEILIAIVIAVGLVGIIVPILPGDVLVLAAILIWAGELGDRTGWLFAAAAATVIVLGAIVKYVVPGRRMRTAGIPTSTMLIGAVLAVIGFFVIPVVGLPIGFVLGIYLAEWRRIGRDSAWPATKHALKAVGLGMLIEFTAAITATIIWVVGVVVT